MADRQPVIGDKDLPHFTVFADESGTVPPYRCFGIGCVILPDTDVEELNQLFGELSRTHGLVGELRWKKIGSSHGPMNMAIDLLKTFLARGWRYSAIMVWKEKYRNWKLDGQETAFYKMYNQLLTDRVRRVAGHYTVHFDDRSDAYDKNDEVMHIVSNHMLRQCKVKGNLNSVTKRDSRESPGIQVADLFTGAITASHNLYLDPAADVNGGKRILIDRLASILGWQDLASDTFPEETFNIWNFPWKEYRNCPGSRSIAPKMSVQYVASEELQESG